MWFLENPTYVFNWSFAVASLVTAFSLSFVSRLFLPARNPIESVLFGLVVWAVFASIACSYCSLLASQRAFWLCIVICISLALVFDIKNLKKEALYHFKCFGGVFFAFLVFSFCFPLEDILVYTDPSDHIRYFRYDAHYSYQANVSIEASSADYSSRLKVRQVYPFEFRKYHFFNANIIAALFSFEYLPTLFSYFHSKFLFLFLCIFLLIYSIFDFLQEVAFAKFKTVLIFLAWIFLGLTAFGSTQTWNFQNTGTLSSIALAMAMLSLLKAQRAYALIYLVVVGLSAVRMLPAVAGVICTLCIIWVWDNLFGRVNESKFSIRESLFSVSFLRCLVLGLLFLVYTVATLFSGAGYQEPLFSERIIDIGWYSNLSLYKILSLAFDFFKLNHDLTLSSEDALRIFWQNNSRRKWVGLILFFGLFVVAMCFLFKKFYSKIQKQDLGKVSGVWWLVYLLISILLVFKFSHFRYFVLFLIPYIILQQFVIQILLEISSQDKVVESNLLRLNSCLQGAWFASILFLAMGSGHIQGALLFVLADGVLWTLLLILPVFMVKFYVTNSLSYRKNMSHVLVLLVFYVLATVFPAYSPTNLLLIHPYGGRYQPMPVDLFYDKNFHRSVFLTKDFFINEENPSVNSQIDFYSVALGAKMKFEERTSGNLIAYPFANIVE